VRTERKLALCKEEKTRLINIALAERLAGETETEEERERERERGGACNLIARDRRVPTCLPRGIKFLPAFPRDGFDF